jgi:uncharacterized protein (DUF934 family)
VELDVRGRRVAVERRDLELLAQLARAQAARSSRARDLAVLLEGAREGRPVLLQRGDERTVARLLRDEAGLSAALRALQDALTTS